MSKKITVGALTRAGQKGYLGVACCARLASNGADIALPADTQVEFVESPYENASTMRVLSGSYDWNGAEVIIGHSIDLR